MARKRFSDEDVLNLLRQIELALSTGSDVQSACRKVGISDGTYYTWRKRYGGMAKSQLHEFKSKVGGSITRRSSGCGVRRDCNCLSVII